MKQAVEVLKQGRSAQINPRGNSMTPLIKSGQTVTLKPVRQDELQAGTIVLAKVRGKLYLHKIVRIFPNKPRYLIGNNHGGINGWTTIDKIYGMFSSLESL
jgi:phage repressor protein C with HTH and peptisase S24 domain